MCLRRITLLLQNRDAGGGQVVEFSQHQLYRELYSLARGEALLLLWCWVEFASPTLLTDAPLPCLCPLCLRSVDDGGNQGGGEARKGRTICTTFTLRSSCWRNGPRELNAFIDTCVEAYNAELRSKVDSSR